MHSNTILTHLAHVTHIYILHIYIYASVNWTAMVQTIACRNKLPGIFNTNSWFSCKKKHSKIWSGKWGVFCRGHNVFKASGSLFKKQMNMFTTYHATMCHMDAVYAKPLAKYYTYCKIIHLCYKIYFEMFIFRIGSFLNTKTQMTWKQSCFTIVFQFSVILFHQLVCYIIFSCISLSPFWRQPIASINVDVSPRTRFSDFVIKIPICFCQGNAIENIVWKMTATFSHNSRPASWISLVGSWGPFTNLD